MTAVIQAGHRVRADQPKRCFGVDSDVQQRFMQLAFHELLRTTAAPNRFADAAQRAALSGVLRSRTAANQG